jgi:hypothetical protein
MWVIAADSTACRIFAAGAPAGPLREQDLVSDLPGRTFDSKGAGRHAKQVPVGPKEARADGVQLDPQVRALVRHEVDKNLSRMDAAAIRTRLPGQLFPT